MTPLRADTVCFTYSAAQLVRAYLPSDIPAEHIETLLSAVPLCCILYFVGLILVISTVFKQFLCWLSISSFSSQKLVILRRFAQSDSESEVFEVFRSVKNDFHCCQLSSSVGLSLLELLQVIWEDGLLSDSLILSKLHPKPILRTAWQIFSGSTLSTSSLLSKVAVILCVRSTIATLFIPQLSYLLCISLSIELEHATQVIPSIANSYSITEAVVEAVSEPRSRNMSNWLSMERRASLSSLSTSSLRDSDFDCSC